METEYEDEIQDIFESPSAFVHFPVRDKRKESEVDSHEQMPFNLQWIYGLNENTPIINMNGDNSNQVFYAAAYHGILYDYITKKMRFLQGHRNIITNIARDGSGKILVTADSGEDNCVNIWNSETLKIMKTILQPHETYELEKMSLSIDAKYFLTFGYEEEPTIKLWNWLDEENEPIAKMHVEDPNRDVVTIVFDPSCSNEFCMAFKRKLIFGYITKDGGNHRIRLRKCLVHTKISDYGNFQCITYNTTGNQVLACTDKGYLAIFKASSRPEGGCKFLPKVYLKIVKIEKRGIVVVKDCDGFIVVCNEDKQIHIYSTDIKILHRFDDFDLGDIKALSFNMTPNNCEEGKDSLPIRLTLTKRKWQPQTFIRRDAYINLKAEGIGLIDFVNQKFYNIFNGFRKIISLAVHPERTLVCVGDILGKIQLIDFENKLIMSRGNLPYEMNTCENEKLRMTYLKFSHSGAFLVCGVNNGYIWIYDAMLLQLVSTEPLKHSKSSIKQIEFSHDSIFMAASNAVGYIFLYKYDCNASFWKFIGKEKAHCKPITNIFFESSEILKLLTFAEDGMVNVYEIELLEDGKTTFSKMKSVKIEKYANTHSIVNEIWPGEKGLLITASDDYKYKVFNYKKETILATYLGPKYTSPVLKMLKLPSKCGDTEYMVFCTQKHIGIQKFPLDGNPFTYIAMLGHPIKVNDFIITTDGKTLFTSGEGEHNFLQWSINTLSAEVNTQLGGEGVNPFATLLEGGKFGWIFGQLKVLFYYAQIICQGESTPYLRKISDVIQASTLPDIMRAIGYYPTEYEIQNLMREVHFHIFDTTVNNDVSFEEFVKLYVNYRPAFGDPFCKYEDAFREFVDRQRDGSVKLHKSVLISTLTSYGENVTESTVKKILQILAAQIAQKDKTEKFTQEELDSLLPKAMSMDFFFGDLLGFNMNDLYNSQKKPQ